MIIQERYYKLSCFGPLLEIEYPRTFLNLNAIHLTKLNQHRFLPIMLRIESLLLSFYKLPYSTDYIILLHVTVTALPFPSTQMYSTQLYCNKPSRRKAHFSIVVARFLFKRTSLMIILSLLQYDITIPHIIITVKDFP